MPAVGANSFAIGVPNRTELRGGTAYQTCGGARL